MSIRPRFVAALMSTCAIATIVLVALISRDPGAPALPRRITAPAIEDAKTATPGLRWFVGDGLFVSSIDPAAQPLDGPPADWASSLHILNPGPEPAHVELAIYRADAAPRRSAIEVPPGRISTIELGRRRDVPRGAAFWIAVDADRPVFPQLVHRTFRPWDLVPEGVAILTPVPAPLDASHQEWVYPDAFQGGTTRWLEQETVTLLNPWPAPAEARVTFEFRDGRRTRTHDVALPPERVAVVDLSALYPDDGSPLSPALSGDFSIAVSATRPVVTQQTRRLYWRGRKEVTSLSARVPLRRAEVSEAREWYYAGGWTRDLGILPRDGQTDRTWHLLFTYPLGGGDRSAELQPAGSSAAGVPQRLVIASGRSDLQWLHLAPWRDLFSDETPWGFTLRADGPVAPAVTNAEFEAWSQAMPGALSGGNLVSDVAARRRESWLGVAYHGGSDDDPVDWSAAWQFFNPGAEPVRGSLFFHFEDAAPLAHRVVVPPGSVVRVTGDAVAGLPQGRPFMVMATADRPFAAHAWVRTQARGVPTVRAMSNAAGIGIQLVTEPAAPAVSTQ